MYPHERSLVKRMAGRPFAIVGVNSDQDRETVKKIKEEGIVTWRSFWNGGGTSGPISRRWNITSWPTLFLIDHEGILRNKWKGAPEAEVLDRAVEELVRKAEGAEGK